MGSCILCKSGAVINRQDNASRTIYNCQSCGVFVVSDLVEAEAKKHANEVAAFLMSRRMAQSNDILLLSFEKAKIDREYLQLTVQQIVEQFPDTFSGQMDMALLNLARMSDYAGAEIRIESLKQAPLFYVRKTNFEALSFIIRSMREDGLLEVNFFESAFLPCGVTVSAKGWDRISKLKEGDATGQEQLFAWVPREGSPLRDQFCKAVRKTARECGYNVLDDAGAEAEGKAGFELIARINASGVVVCDLTEALGEAYFASAYALAKKKLCILTCHQSAKQQLQLNAEQLGVLFWDDQDSLYIQISSALRANQ